MTTTACYMIHKYLVKTVLSYLTTRETHIKVSYREKKCGKFKSTFYWEGTYLKNVLQNKGT